ncbi:GLEYA domain-containing protein [Chaetomium sp. MPI-CAGE-AT-0009]|nr:GLEYA domain-containing protein [Chaetomium sp. MPI-CAGE-AT-0009]
MQPFVLVLLASLAVATETKTVTVTETAACTQPSSSPTTCPIPPACSCPIPPTCGNLGFDWAYYNNSARNTDTTYSSFHPDSFKNVRPLHVGTTSYVGGLYSQPGSQVPTGPIYGSKERFKLDFFALNHHAYLYACQTGTYRITIPYANDAVYLWIGAKAYIGWTDENADAKARYNQPDHVAGSANFDIRLLAGTYVPIRFIYGQAQYGGGFYFNVTTPSGQVIVSHEAHDSPYVVRHSCDGIIAPKFPPFGREL